MAKETDIQKLERWLLTNQREEEIDGILVTRSLTGQERQIFQQILTMPLKKPPTRAELQEVYARLDLKLEQKTQWYTSVEALYWLESSLAPFKTLSSDLGVDDNSYLKNEKALNFVKGLYTKGAVKVTAISVSGYLEKAEDQMTDEIVIELPQDKTQRTNLFAVSTKTSKKHGYGPTPDVEQRFLLSSWK